jgi:neutral ceramidase
MKSAYLIRSYLPALLLASVLIGCSTNHQSPPETTATAQYPFKVGLAEIDITPPIGYRLAGYYDERFSTGVHDPLQAKAIILQQSDKKIAMVFCDLVGLSLHVTTNARAIASRKTGIPVTNIVMAATHSHTGPLFDDIRRDYFHETAIAQTGEDAHEAIYYPQFLTDQLVKVVSEANAKLKPAEVDEGITTQPGLPFNRRYYMKNGRVAFNPGQLNPNIVGPAGPVDSDVSILMVKDAQQHKPVGGLTVFAMHADTTGGTEISADYPNYIQQTLRNAFGQNYISAFGAGTCGDINHINVKVKEKDVKGFAVSEKLGTMIGETVIHYAPDLRAIEHPSLAVRDRMLTLPLQEATPDEVTAAKALMPHLDDTNVDFYAKVRAVKAVDLAARGKTWPMEIQVFRLDKDTAVVFLPAEIFVEFGLAIKKASPFRQTFVIALANDRPSYMPTLKAFKEGSYEVMNSRLAAGGGEALTQTAIQLLNELKE